MVASGDDVTSYDVNLALQHNAGPSTLGVTDFTATSGTTEKLLDTWTGTVTAGHKYRVKYVWAYQCDTLNDRYFVRIREGLTTAGTQIAVVNQVHLTPINTLVPGIPTEAEWTASVTTAAQSFCATIARNSGGGVATVRGFTSQQRILSVVWLGPYA
jgi:hypothetical protein